MPEGKLTRLAVWPVLPELDKRRCCAGLLGLMLLGTAISVISVYVKHQGASSQHDQKLSSISLHELSQHDSREDCWMAIDGSIFDVTEYATHHPNPEFIYRCCGIDGTPLYDSAHPASILEVIRRRRVGSLEVHSTKGLPSSSVVTPEQPIPDIQFDELLEHYSPSDCWMAIFGIVYDVTKYSPFHPNPHFVTDYCGLEVSDLFDGAHAGSALKVVQQRIVGKLVVPQPSFAPGLIANTISPSHIESESRAPSIAPIRPPTFADTSNKIDLLLGSHGEP